ncbi:MAG: glycosyltransferase family 2 protein [Proteiniphilum sp.]|jgi:GT2 family glycosyltransferase|nr:glycosyltransferase family 2 protein [Proteiniphilum sp.]MDD2937222.1 glycosyltransferase family 2 protein [Proteiniphilum sp.]MDD3076467.1 glycosyltransferase family 2 protein [Proteiniphilum sp.]MDD3778906.1 glycosyltransferase family 2 protein [Proteiniphilum sp.]MDD3956366.1 glycosyltransferase family 2 protein [Proteiniphilum sp.]
MNKKNVAVLLTCHNRKAKTIACLESLYQADIPPAYHIDVYLTDDGSTDGTSEAVSKQFPGIHIIKGDGNLFWAGGMRLAWKTAIEGKSFDSYLLLNDDVTLHRNFMLNLLETEAHSLAETGKSGIYSGATIDDITSQVTYGGSVIKQNHFLLSMQKLHPGSYPQRCDLVNANVLWVSGEVVKRIGIFDERYTHGIADYDYSMRAKKKHIPIWLASGVCGICNHDHEKNWKTGIPLKKRISWMKSPKGLAYSEYMFYVKRHFPLYFPYSFIMIWMKVFFPFVWERFKN